MHKTVPADRKWSFVLTRKSLLSLHFALLLVLLTLFKAEARYPITPGTLKGKKVGTNNLPLQGVIVTIPGTTTGTLTGNEGNYLLTVPATAKVVEFTLVGYAALRVSINGKDVINITLELNAKALEDVAVTGYTSYNRGKSAIASTTVTADKISQVPLTVDQVLQGRVPELVVAAGSGQPV